ncbi:ribonucleoside-diphosphate reductase subunit alpha [Bacillus atrophaeus]|uniref:ribonucleoside-diphosphate reductase subunit alpha n=1 Tax=Bacillus atrophaeus TaxID=1452 RepID=UPI002E204942|nr:ribonucleoside-diphosphate reductase subunit alpha [Bacillus atrophaeus]
MSHQVEQETAIFDDVVRIIDEAQEKFGLPVEDLRKKVKDVTSDRANEQLMFYALNSIDMGAPNWTYVAARSYLNQLYTEASQNRNYSRSLKYGNFYKLLEKLTEEGVYSPKLLEAYSKEEIAELQGVIDPDKDQLFSYIGLFLLADRYLATDKKERTHELPQERFMVIAMNLMMKEPKEKRIDMVKEAYWALSNLYMTVATPTLSNSGKAFGQLSSCFIDTVDDSLDGIYLNNWDIARLSKNGGGIGIYFGKVRALGSAIKDFEGNSSGILPWIKSINQTAVSVDQLGQRQGAVAVYYDVFGKDIMRFLDLKTNNGDDRNKAHDIFTGIAIPDLFMETLKEKDENGKSVGEWHVFCPYEVKKFMGWKDEDGVALGLEDFYDEEGEDEKYFTEKYREAVAHPLLPRKTYRAMDIMLRIMKSQLEKGVPYMFYRDEVNRQNANKHVVGRGRTAIFCSNLCTEIAQNQSPTVIVEEYKDERGYNHIVRRPGDFVVCNLSSINLPKAVRADVLERLIKIQVRMLDNVIDLNTIPVAQAQDTNQKYRAIGLGTFGWHHLLAVEGIYWESEQAMQRADELYEEIAYQTIKASMELGREKGAYPVFEGSEWETGAYFERKGYTSPRHIELQEQIRKNGLRNGYLMAVAPNSSTAKIGDSTDGIDPLYNVEYAEEKKNFKFKVTAPELDHNNYEYYKKARHELDQKWSIRQNAKRQRHIDQAISFNLYVRHDIKAKELLEIHFAAYEEKLKTTYYVRSTSQEEIEECEMCHS